MKFVVDRMLGRLSTWLRILGFDTINANSFRGLSNFQEDSYLLALAQTADRILLTRDIELHTRAENKGLRSLLVVQGNIIEQLQQVKNAYGIKIEAEPTVLRCTECNTLLQTASVNDVRSSHEIFKLKKIGVDVEKFLVRYQDYYKCCKCGKVYWKGGHWNNILKGIKRLADG